MGKLKDIDTKAAQKGSALETVWQFVKFIVVSLLAMIVQFALLNLLGYIFNQATDFYTRDFSWFVFNYPVKDGGFGYFLAFNIANVAAQIVAFFVNREKTFNANNNIPVTLTVYIIFTIALLCFSAWLSPTLNGFLLSKHFGKELSENIATMACAAIQFFLYFPVDKLLMRNKDKKKKGAAEKIEQTK